MNIHITDTKMNTSYTWSATLSSVLKRFSTVSGLLELDFTKIRNRFFQTKLHSHYYHRANGISATETVLQ